MLGHLLQYWTLYFTLITGLVGLFWSGARAYFTMLEMLKDLSEEAKQRGQSQNEEMERFNNRLRALEMQVAHMPNAEAVKELKASINSLGNRIDNMVAILLERGK